MDISYLHEQLEATIGRSIGGVSVGNATDKATWRVDYAPGTTAAQITAAQNFITAYDPATTRPVTIPLDVLQARMEAEPIGATNAWETYVNWAFGTAARRNAFIKIMFVEKPIRQDSTAFRSSMTAAGISDAAQDRILA